MTAARTAILAISLAPLVIGQARGATIVENASPDDTTAGVGFFGQSFTTPAGSSYNNLTFSWLKEDGTLLAGGSVFLLSQEYLGSPTSLSSSEEGFIGQSTSVSEGIYFFDPAVTVAESTQYWIYMDDETGLDDHGYNRTDSLPGGQVYQTSPFSNPFQEYGARSSLDAAFRFSGDPIPEPTLLPLLALGAVACSYRRRRNG